MKILLKSTLTGMLALVSLIAVSLACSNAFAAEKDVSQTLQERVAKLTPEQQAALLALLDQMAAGKDAKTTAASAMPPEATMRQAIRDFDKDVANKDLSLDRAMAVISKDFQHPSVGGKDALRQLAESNWEMIKAGAPDTKISLDHTKFTVTGDKAEAYPVEISSSIGSVSLTVHGKLEDGVWRVVGVDGI